MTNTSSRKNTVRARVIALFMAGLVLLAGLFSAALPSVISETEANWNASEHAVSEQVIAGEVSAPQNVRCTGGGLLSSTTIRWEPPEEGLPPEAYYVVEVRQRGLLEPEGVRSTRIIEDPAATSWNLDTNLSDVLEGLLALGQNHSVTVRTAIPGEWLSDVPDQTVDFSILLGLITNCG